MAGRDGELTAELAAFAAEIEVTDLPAPLVATQKAVWLDAIACALAARVADVPIPALFAAARASGAAIDEGAVFVSGRQSAALAASLNGSLVHALVFDAAGASGAHLGMIAVAPVLAAAEFIGGRVSGGELLAASIAACEVHARLVKLARGPSLVGQAGWLDGQLLGVFGACAGAGRILGLDAEQMASAFGLALMQASGTREIIRGGDPPLKSLYGGPANFAGVLAALLAADGVDARCDALASVLSDFFDCSPAPTATDGLGSHFVGGEVHFKEWPATGVVQPYVYAGQSLRAQAAFDLDEIRCLSLVAPVEEARWVDPLVERCAPSSAAVACNSVPYGLACTLLDGELWLGRLSREGLGADDVRHLLDCLEVRFVERRHEATVGVTFASGGGVEVAVFNERTDNFGALEPRRVEDKLRRCNSSNADPLEDGSIERIIELIAGLDQLADAAALSDLLTRGR